MNYIMSRARHASAFTLIELLVVISIIGILSAIVLASLNSARLKGNDASIKANSRSIVSQSQLYFDNYGTYGSVGTSTVTTQGNPCGGSGLFTDPTIVAAMKAITKAAGSATLDNTLNSYMYCGAGGTYWEIVTPFSSDPSVVWCVGSNGTPHVLASSLFNTPTAALC